MKSILFHKYKDLISIENLLLAWQEFVKGKRNKKDVQIFQFNLMDNILQLHYDLKNKTYKHGGYQQFKINDPKPRTIHKALVRDRLLHHAVYRILYPFFDRTFISDSFSCRNTKGMHKSIKRFLEFIRIVSKNNTRTCWILKCDIKKFFASIDQNVLINILEKRLCHSRESGNLVNKVWIPGQARNDTLNLLKEIIFSFKSSGLPLGNLTSQLFANVYLNEFDQFVKHKLRVKYYVRYADDFTIWSRDQKDLENLIPSINDFLQNELKLTLHPDKVFIKTLSSGVDFLGWVNFVDHRVLRNRTKKRMFGRLSQKNLQSYLGLIKHGNTQKVKNKVLKLYVKNYEK